MTKHEAAIVTAYTGILCGDWSNACEYMCKLMGRPIWTHEYADKKLVDEIKRRAKDDFCALEVKEG